MKMGPLLARSLTLMGVMIPTLLLCFAWRRGDSLFAWKMTLLATEFGHFLAVLTLLSGVAGFWAWGSSAAWRYGMLGLGLVAGCVLLIPAWQAGGRTGEFSITRLFFPFVPRPEVADVIVERRRLEDRENDENLEVVICRPPESRLPGASLPWVVSVHGGGWNAGRPDEFLAWDSELASHGFVVVMPEYRLAPRYQWPAPRKDLLRAVRWMRENAGTYGIDPENLTVLGRSAGGQIATATAYGSPDLGARRCIAFYAPQDMFFAWKYGRPDDVLDSLSLLREYLGGSPEERSEVYESASPIRLINEKTPPTLLIHGTRDTLVWVKQSRRLTTEIEKKGGDVIYHELPWATHACDYFPWSPGGQFSMQAVLEFLEESE